MGSEGFDAGRRVLLMGAGGAMAALVLAACSDDDKGSTTSSPTPTPSPTGTTSPRTSPSPTGGATGTTTASPTGPATTSLSAGATSVTIKNFAFTPSTLNVAPGTLITVTNQDTAAHTLTAESRAFDTGILSPGQTAVITAPSQSGGSFPFLCTIHPQMKGTLTIR
ncbi:cupredoxin domain-containing protein [Kitasatospora camelliae]|uniref:Cupredoxin domain-containing protein n=1 Tax=Kitasatospora camelliae TaxID=3156397 RepID=A0AAU8K407_9ACTN